MLEGPLRALSIILSLAVLAGFALFVVDETREASAQSAAQIEGREAATTASPDPSQERAREKAHGDVREAIDDVNDVLLAPFAGLTDDSSTAWVRRGVPALIALAVYGLGLGTLARYGRGRA
ncbi:hypothetical protein [Paraconexibacter sp.]|uniref:hypothetical protein n=1 Tax=Paraconexibacter sp. TaxID=2949640 RepID=UPI0035671E9B